MLGAGVLFRPCRGYAIGDRSLPMACAMGYHLLPLPGLRAAADGYLVSANLLRGVRSVSNQDRFSYHNPVFFS
jgi:hypothetical protein